MPNNLNRELLIIGNDDGTHTLTFPNPDGVMESHTIPAGVPLERIEAMLSETLGPLMGKRTVHLSKDVN